jgi:hypothetical protein
MTVSNYSTTSSNNTSINSISIAEGMPPSNVNNAIRNELSDLRTYLNDKEWFIVGDRDGACTFTRASSTSVTVASTDVTSDYHAKRRVKIVGSNTGTIYGIVSSSSFSTNTTINFTFDSGSISGSDSTVDVYVGSPYTNPSVPVVDEDAMGSDSAIIPPSQQSVKAFVTSGTITMTNKTLTSPVLNTAISGTAFKDEDDMSSDSATAVASQQSIKAYVDSQVTAQDLDISDGSSTIAIDLDSETLGLLGGTGIDSAASGNNVTMAIDSTVATLTGSQSLTNKTINGSSNTLSNIANSSLTNSSITVTDGSNSTATALGGTITYAAGEGLDVAESSGTITYSGEDATVSNKGIASFDTNNFSVSSGAVSIKTAGVGNTQVATGIASSKIADGSVSDTEFQHINSLSSNAQTQLDGKLTASDNLSDVASASTSRTNLGLGNMAVQNSGTVSISGGSITGIGSPSSNSDVAIKSYVDEAVAGLRTRIIAEAGTTANIDLTADLQNGDTIDGVTLVTGDRVLVKDQSTATQNGLYIVVSSGTASRDPEYDTIAEISGSLIVINQGSTNDNKIFLCTTDSDGSIGSTNITYTQVTPSNTGTVTSIGLTQSGSEFTISNSPVTSAGNITLDVNRISATKIGANTNISDTEYGYLNGVTSNIQTQLDNSASLGDAISFAVALGS